MKKNNQAITKQLRPYEKCVEFGAGMLTDSELLAVIIKSGVKGMSAVGLADKILYDSDSCDGILGLINKSIPELMSINGVGYVKAIQIQCICELSKRIAMKSAAKRLNFNSPQLIAGYYMEEMRHKQSEELILAMIDTKCRLIKDVIMSVGTINASLITPREIFGMALKYNAYAIVLLHNHPSGDPTPSKNDIEVTQRIDEAGKILGIRLIDHIVIGDNSYTSLKEKGIF